MSAHEPDAYLAILNAPWPASTTTAEQAAADQRKLFATCQARAALRGIVLVESHTEQGRSEWISSWHAMVKAFSSLDEVVAWLDRVEGKR